MIKNWFRVYIYIRNRWYFEFIKERHVYINLHDLELNYSICWIRVYIYIGFGDFQSLILFDKIRNSTVLNMFLNIFIKEGGINGIIGLLEYSICWFHVYIYIGFYVILMKYCTDFTWTFSLLIHDSMWSCWTS